MYIDRRFDILIILLVSSLSFGGIGGAFQVVRVLAILLLPFLAFNYNYVRSYLKPYMIGTGIFYLFCLASLTWTPDFSEGTKQLIYYPIHFLLFLEIIAFSRLAKDPVMSISMGWMVATSLTLVVALWEISTGHHLSFATYKSDIVLNTDAGYVLRRHASVTFGNFNGYVTFLCLALPFLYYRVSLIVNLKFVEVASVIVTLLAAVCLIYNASRGGILTLAGMTAIFVIMNSKNRYTFPMIAVLSLLAGLILYHNTEMLDVIKVRSSDGNLFNNSDRVYIWNAAWKAYLSSYGLGVGIGGMVVAMGHFTTGIKIAHNLFLEILLQYGIFFCLLFVYFLTNLFKKMLHCRILEVKTTLLMALITMPIYTIISSGYLLSPPLYAFFASLVVFADNDRTQMLRNYIRILNKYGGL